MTGKSKPGGVVATMVYAAIGGLIAVPTGLLLLLASSIPGKDGLVFTLGGIVFTGIGIAYWVAVFGLKSLQEWGRQTMLWISIVSVPLGIASIFPVWPEQQMTAGNTVLQLVGVAISGLIIHYLLKPSIKSLFS